MIVDIKKCKVHVRVIKLSYTKLRRFLIHICLGIILNQPVSIQIALHNEVHI